jgi:hypothetical protein
MEDRLQFDSSGGINTVYSFFYTYNFTDTQSVTGYALPFAGFTFRPNFDDQESLLSNKKVFWDFGDGTVVQALTAKHAYRLPGKYKVKNYFYDKNGNSYINSYTSTVIVKNIIEDSISFVQPITSTISVRTGEITDPIPIISSVSYQTYTEKPEVSIVAYASAGNDISNFFETGLDTIRYGYLYPNSSFLSLVNTNGITEFVNVTSFATAYEKIYCRPVNNDIVLCTKECPNAFFCGVTGISDVYFRSDFASSEINLLFGAEPEAFQDDTNTTTIGVSCAVESDIIPTSLSITSNGLDSEGISDTLFNINKNKFSGSGISFVVKVKDPENFTIRNIPQLTNISLILTDGVVEFPAVFEQTFINNDISSNIGGFYRGLCYADLPGVTENVFISAAANVNGQLITGTSDMFNIYPKSGIYNIAKRGEDIDFTSKFREISFQPLFSELNTLYNDYIKNIFGDIASDQTSLGKLTYEKIKNFVDNNAVIDTSNVDKLISIFEMINLKSLQFNSTNFRFPSAVSRFVDLLSINKSRLFGFTNKFADDFRSYGYVNSSIHGKNIGTELTTTESLNEDDIIISFEKYSSSFTKLYPYIPLDVENTSTFQIIDYKDSWGWGLVLPENASGQDISKYYTFYRYLPTEFTDIEDSIINFDDPNTTLQHNISSFALWSEKDGIISNIISNQFYKGLNLIK